MRMTWAAPLILACVMSGLTASTTAPDPSGMTHAADPEVHRKTSDGSTYGAPPGGSADPLSRGGSGLTRWEWLARTGIAHAAEGTPTPTPTPIAIPANTFIARRFPGRGKGVGGGKHLRIVHRPEDGRLYFLGGDYSGPGGMDSGRNEIYSYSIKGDDWRLEWPYCGPPGSVQPSHPDQVGWVYDTTRKLFWMIPGYMGGDTGKCNQAGSKLIRFQIMTFDPSNRSWAVPGIELPYKPPGNYKIAQYDPVTDTILVFGASAPDVYILDLKRGTWLRKRFSGSANLGKEYTAIDPERRVIYVIEPKQAKLYRYDIDLQELAPIADAPRGSDYDTTMPVWDSVNRVLLFPQYGKTSDIRLHVFHPDTTRWELDLPIRQPEGYRVRGTNAVFDPYQNVMLIFGVRGSEEGSPPNPYLFLYRYQKATTGG